ncbi:hypothetical protein NKR23_g3305 [Pleurostoma richardsiae]|uniref:CST complex subunit Stn1 N-terminal domain-containing protein n=1 Tax=Pleurostoma richardsiae TaxID=41990 RepID=A0AA38RMX5_9PEZI|nr:hypothetical protein NKR23_g3305 [Pleurostoma richardsiae]
MTGGAEEKAPIYPQYCFRLSPTISRWCPLRAADIERLTSHPGFAGQDLFFYLNHPIKWARVAGVVVAIDEYYGRRIYTIDDSSGACIECTVTAPVTQPAVAGVTAAGAATGNATGTTSKPTSTSRPEGGQAKEETKQSVKAEPPQVPIPDGLDVGSIVDVKGGLKLFREYKQIKAEKIVVLRSTEQEVALWEKLRQFHDDVLSKPWALEDKQVRKCRREAESAERDAERKARKKKAAEREAADQRTRVERRDKDRPTAGRALGLERKRQPKAPLKLKGKYDALGI